MTTPDFIHEAASLAATFWQPLFGPPSFVATSCNSVFTIRLAGSQTDSYLRLTDADHRAKTELLAELDFVSHLAAGGAAVSRPVPSCDGHVLHTVQAGGRTYFASVFTPIGGEMLRYGTEPENRAPLQAWGRALGQIHRLAERYKLPPDLSRFTWSSEPVMANAERHLPQTEVEARQELDTLRAWLAEAPQDPQSFGMIHGDFGRPNCRLVDGRVAAFDFGDCGYHWFAYDLAIMVYPCRFNPRAERMTCLSWITKGYRQARPLDEFWTQHIGYFMRLRGLWMFIYHCSIWDLSSLTDHQRGWFAQMRQTFRNPIDW